MALAIAGALGMDAVIGNDGSDGFPIGVVAIEPGLGVYYAPFPAPIGFGSGLNLAITIRKTGSAAVTTVTPGLRIAWIF